MIRLTGGVWHARTLVAPTGLATRPAAARVRKALFDLLTHRLPALEGAHVLDLCAGAGTLAFEALSRGGASACCVDTAPNAIQAITVNAHRLAATCSSVRADATSFNLSRLPEAPFTLVLCDPPWTKDPLLGARALKHVRPILAPHAVFALGTQNSTPPPLPSSLEIVHTRCWGKACFHLGRYQGETP